MPELKCTVQTCVHNQNYYCNLDKIQVGGNSAKRADETCCDSFQERSGASGGSMGMTGSYGNSYGNMAGTGSASACSSVDCKAVQCQYNDNCRCNAGKISVEGGDACQSSETECATFTC